MPEPDVDRTQPLFEGRDYYMDGPFIVFTREYHLRRGACCQSGCRHCPWDFQATPSDSSDSTHSRS